jgi:O-antigen/teichoic acid export membrane protein
MASQGSHGQILRSSSIIGASSLGGIVLGLVRTKVAAVLLGPGGVGLIGIYTNLITTASGIAALGFGTAGVRSIADADANHDGGALAAAWRALSLGTIALACAGSAIFWLAGGAIAKAALGDASYGHDVSWLAIGVLLTVLAGAQTAKLNGFRRIGEIAYVNVLSAICATILSVAAVLAFGRRGLLAFVLALPVSTFLIGYAYARRVRIHGGDSRSLTFAQLASQWIALGRVGVGVMVAAITSTGGALVVRAIIERKLGAASLGQFQAAWAISMTYVGYVLTAMATDYFPRLAAAAHDKEAANRLINEQLEVALLGAGPIIVGMLALAPWVVTILYSHKFGAAVAILHWQVLGDVFKVASFPIAYLMLAMSSSGLYIAVEVIFMGAVVGVTWFGLPSVGLQITGVAVLVAYIVYFLCAYLVARRLTSFQLTKNVARLLLLLIVAAASVAALAAQQLLADSLAAIGLALTVTVLCAIRIVRLVGTRGTGANRLFAAISRLRKVDGN